MEHLIPTAHVIICFCYLLHITTGFSSFSVAGTANDFRRDQSANHYLSGEYRQPTASRVRVFVNKSRMVGCLPYLDKRQLSTPLHCPNKPCGSCWLKFCQPLHTVAFCPKSTKQTKTKSGTSIRSKGKESHIYFIDNTCFVVSYDRKSK